MEPRANQSSTTQNQARVFRHCVVLIINNSLDSTMRHHHLDFVAALAGGGGPQHLSTLHIHRIREVGSPEEMSGCSLPIVCLATLRWLTKVHQRSYTFYLAFHKITKVAQRHPPRKEDQRAETPSTHTLTQAPSHLKVSRQRIANQCSLLGYSRWLSRQPLADEHFCHRTGPFQVL